MSAGRSHLKSRKTALGIFHRGQVPAHQPRRITLIHENLVHENLCPIHRGFIAMSGPRSLAVHSDSISTTPRIPVA